jgi:cysteine desulfurase / selenocysteine lyase
VDGVTPANRRAGIVTVRPRDVDAASARLRDARVIHSVREGTIRLSPHCYTTSDEIQIALGALGD